MAGRSQIARVRVLLDDVTSFDPGALVLFCSAVRELGRVGIIVQGTWPKAPRAVKTLADAAFTRFLRGKQPSYDDTTKTLQLYEGTSKRRVPTGLAQSVRLFLKNLNPALGVEEIDTIDLAIRECLENVRVHAYGRVRASKSPKRWYVAGLHDQDAGVSKVAILDLGVGIRATVERQMAVFTRVLQRVLRPTHELIKEATLGRLTASGLSHRGKGLSSLREFAGRGPGRTLRVQSSDGMVTWSSSGPSSRAIPKVKGTLVCLEIHTK